MTASTAASSGKRDLPLEALRGLAALSVIAWHFFLAFDPAVLSDPGYGLAGTPFFAFIHGTAAISVFFVLSGYVLTRRYFETGQRRILVVGALKRWFRLFLPVFLSVMISWFLFHFHLYAYEEAGSISRSGWLASFGFAMKPPFDPTFGAALENGFSEAFVHRNNAFNPLLWTIHTELMGSYIAFAFAALVAGLKGNGKMIALATALIALPICFVDSLLLAFLPGTLLAFYAPRLKSIKKASTALAFLTVGIVFLGYRNPIGFYGFLDNIAPPESDTVVAYTSTIGAILVMISFIGYAPLRRSLQGPAARFLGRMSFPLYLVHLILIFSLGSAVFALTEEGNSRGAALVVTALALLPAVLALAGIFAVIDLKWIAFVNAVFRRIKISD